MKHLKPSNDLLRRMLWRFFIEFVMKLINVTDLSHLFVYNHIRLNKKHMIKLMEHEVCENYHLFAIWPCLKYMLKYMLDICCQEGHFYVFVSKNVLRVKLYLCCIEGYPWSQVTFFLQKYAKSKSNSFLIVKISFFLIIFIFFLSLIHDIKFLITKKHKILNVSNEEHT